MPKRSNKKPQIMRAAERFFTSRRFHEITLDEVAKAARVSKGTIYTYFDNKEDLFFQTAMSGFDELCELLGRKVPEGAGFREQLLCACEEVTSFFKRHRQRFRMIQSEDSRMPWHRGSPRERWRAQRKKLVSAVATIMCRGVADGEVRRDVPVDTLADYFLGMLRTRGRHLSEAPGKARSPELLVEVFCHGACGRSGRGGRQE
ncbi:MAG: TetR/AcrR family transcriptional regulator [Planctomycetota bacterium]